MKERVGYLFVEFVRQAAYATGRVLTFQVSKQHNYNNHSGLFVEFSIVVLISVTVTPSIQNI